MIRFIFTIICLILFVILTGFNLDNKCTIWFFHNFKDIPVFVALLTSFLAGILVSLPYCLIHHGKKDKSKEKKSKKNNKKEVAEADDEEIIVGDDE